MSRTCLRIMAVASISIFGSIVCSNLFAQARPVGRAAQIAAAAESGKEIVVIRKLSGLSTDGKAKTPEYAVSPSENSRAQDWARIAVVYETESEWIDELEFRYFTIVKHPKTGEYTKFPASVNYVDIPKGKNHVSTVFLRPNTIARYGDLERFAVEIYAKGELVAATGVPENPPQWWHLPINARTLEGVLLNRAQTPFAFVAWDNYETIKPR